ncbi:hypothetical protein DFJ73DRAFT_803645 [Zopfochytrium polystomum]|nr:hypothetical protein DFJ73DRAFT_803645 [Zopfochytrium polystomum]
MTNRNQYGTRLADLDVLKEDLDARGKNPDQLTRDLVQFLVDKNQKGERLCARHAAAEVAQHNHLHQPTRQQHAGPAAGGNLPAASTSAPLK